MKRKTRKYKNINFIDVLQVHFPTILHFNYSEKIKTIQNDEDTEWKRIGGIGIPQWLQTKSELATRVDNNISS